MKDPKTFRDNEKFTMAVTRVTGRGQVMNLGKMRMEADEKGSVCSPKNYRSYLGGNC